MDIRDLDIKAYLDHMQIEYKEKGKNVTSGWCEVSCPYCGDPSFHCGINLESKMFHCWRCSEKGNVITLLHEITKLPYKEIYKSIGPFQNDVLGLGVISNNNNGSYANVHGSNPQKLIFPNHLLDNPEEIHRQYLLNRRFDPEFLTKKYQLKFTYNVGELRFKIIVPVIIDRKKVAWVAADILRKQGCIPYLNAPPEKCIIPVNHCLYNIDSVKDFAVIVEGITDVWRHGDGFIGSFRKGMTSEQIELLISKRPKRVYTMYDPDATEQSQALANKLSGLFPEVSVLELEKDDPADMTQEEVNELRKNIV